MTPSSQSGKNWRPIALRFTVKAGLSLRMDSNKVGQVLLCKDVKVLDQVSYTGYVGSAVQASLRQPRYQPYRAISQPHKLRVDYAKSAQYPKYSI